MKIYGEDKWTKEFREIFNFKWNKNQKNLETFKGFDPYSEQPY